MTAGGLDRFVDVGPLVRLYTNNRLSRLNRLNPRAAQEHVLRRLVYRAASTAFGRRHAFSQIKNIRNYQEQVRIRTYEEFWTEWWEPHFPTLIDVTWRGRISLFANSSGTTTGVYKHIPYTHRMRRAAVAGFLDLVGFHYACRPNSKVLGGAAVTLTGPTTLDRQDNDTLTGPVSAITIGSVPGFLARRVLPPPEIANITNWNEKIRRLAEVATDADVRFLGGSPNWLLIFIAELKQKHGGDNLAHWFPNLELVVHGGINFAPYRNRFAELLEGSHAETREMYSASEGVFAVADRGDGEGLRLLLDGAVFFEFIPAAELGQPTPSRLTVDEVEVGQDYAVVITTAAGLWSYIVGDVVRFVDLSPPRVIVVGRTGNALSEFGEHLIEFEIADAVSSAVNRVGTRLQDYCVGAVHEKTGGRHRYLIEVEGQSDAKATRRMAEEIDIHLKERNADYRELRTDDTAIGPPEVVLVRQDGFRDWMRLRRYLGGQSKLPHIVKDKALFRDIERVAAAEKSPEEMP